jgi:UDP-N-acetylglucosamine 2-epimerase
MKSKVQVFSVLKKNLKTNKEENRKWRLALGHRAISLLKSSIEKWASKTKQIRTLRHNFVKIQFKNQKRIKEKAFVTLRNRFKKEYAI